MPDNICLFAAFVPDGVIPPHTIYYLSELKLSGFTICAAFAGIEKLSTESVSFLQSENITYHLRPNTGHDFGSWQFLIRNGCATDATRVLLANDSVFGPFRSLTPVFRHMEQGPADVWGMVASRAVTPHIQSWFVCFERNSFSSAPVRRVFGQNFTDMTRDELIWHGELGLAIACHAAGLRMEALYSDLHRRGGRLTATNPMHSHWRHLLDTGTVPFIKTELLRDNPYHLRSVNDWEQALPDNSSFSPEWIRTFLRTHPRQQKSRPSNLKGRLLYNLIEQISARRPSK